MVASRFWLVLSCLIVPLASPPGSVWAASSSGAAGVGGDGGSTMIEAEEVLGEDESASPWYGTYSGLFFGPSVLNPVSRYQPSPTLQQDPSRPVIVKHFLTAGYYFSDAISLSATGQFSNEPVQGKVFEVRDPYVKLAHNSLFSTGPWNLYADLRVHFPVTNDSRQRDLVAGFQTFQVLSYDVGRWSFATWGYARANYFGRFGRGNDLELYLGPNMTFQFSEKVAFNLLYEMGASHAFGSEPFVFDNDGTDVQPGISWDITPDVNFSPYLNIYPGQPLETMSFGMTMYWRVI